jgi:hypothetical protein
MTLPAYPRWAGSPWYAPPAIAAVLAVVLLILLPASGPIVYLAWKPTVDAQTRQRLERDLHLLAATHTGGTRWGYIVGDTSERNVRTLLALPEVDGRSGLIADPPRAAGRSIIRLAGPFAVQSFVGLLAGCLLLIGAGAPSTRTRQAYFIVASGMLLIGWRVATLPDVASHEVGDWMGDYDTYTESRSNFQHYFGYDSVRFHFHLGGFVLNLIDRALGSTETSPRQSFQMLSMLMGIVALLEATLVAVIAKWSPQAMRYVGLCFAAPLVLMFFGFKETGYLSLSFSGLPLLLIGLRGTGNPERDTRVIQAGALVLGVHAALQGLGLLAIGSALVIVCLYATRLRRAVSAAATVFTWAFTAYLIWLPLYLIVLGLPIVPAHATEVALRGLSQSHVAYNRLVSPVLSGAGLREIGIVALVVGLPVVLLALPVAARGGERRALAAGATLSAVFMAMYFHVQGLNQEMDMVVTTFPAFFAGAWICAARPRPAVAALGVLAIGHALFWHVVRSLEFGNPAL